MQVIQDWARLRELRSEGRQITRQFSKDYKKLESAADTTAIGTLFDQLGQARLKNSMAIEKVKTDRLLRLAEKYDVPLPSLLLMGNMNENWFSSPFEKHTNILNEHARARLRAEIWEVQRAQWERWTRWIPLLSTLTGLFGAAFGLIVALHKWL